MASEKNLEPKIETSGIEKKHPKNKRSLSDKNATIEERLEELEALPRRNPVLHWAALSLSVLSLVILATWVFSARGPVPAGWIIVDIGLGIVLAIEFFTRSGFRWGGVGYFGSRFFDFVAIVPALALVHNGFVLKGLWVWIILVARFVRVVDRLLGDGFVRRNTLALAEGLE